MTLVLEPTNPLRGRLLLTSPGVLVLGLTGSAKRGARRLLAETIRLELNETTATISLYRTLKAGTGKLFLLGHTATLRQDHPIVEILDLAGLADLEAALSGRFGEAEPLAGLLMEEETRLLGTMETEVTLAAILNPPTTTLEGLLGQPRTT
jgi:hypothetical protein